MLNDVVLEGKRVLDQKQKEICEKIYKQIDAKLQAECTRLGGKIPYIAEHGRYVKDAGVETPFWWTNGFWAGMLWQMYASTGNELYKETAKKSEIIMEKDLSGFVGLHHDVGFQYLHTAVADYRLTGDEKAKIMGLHAASLLAGRFNPTGNFIRAWNDGNGPRGETGKKPGWMIIDCMMNIPLLYWAGKETEDPRFADIANRHAETAMRVLLRPDGSCNHIGILDPETGEVLSLPGGQGYGEGSSWSRGQAWAVYGFALAFLHTGNQEFLDAAKRAAHYFLANVAMTGYVSLVDFRAPKEPVYWDTTATACAVCGLLQIAEMVPEFEKDLYYDGAVKMLMALSEYHCDWNLKTDGILQNGTAAYWRDTDRHVSIIYGDYFYVEGILRLLGKEFMIW